MSRALPLHLTRVVRHPHGWTFMLNGRCAPASYRTRSAARERMRHHKASRTAYYFSGVTD